MVAEASRFTRLMIVIYTARPKKVAHSPFAKDFRFDFGVHLLWHCFNNPMQGHNIYFHPELQ